MTTTFNGSSFRIHVLDRNGTCLRCEAATAGRAARTAIVSDIIRFHVPGARTTVFDPLVSSVIQDLEDFQELYRGCSEDREARSDVLMNDLERHLDELLALRREHLLVGVGSTGEGDGCQTWGYFLIIPQAIDSCSLYVALED